MSFRNRQLRSDFNLQVSVPIVSCYLEMIKENIPIDTFFTASIDKELNDQAYIVPGLGDAGDLAYGHKLS